MLPTKTQRHSAHLNPRDYWQRFHVDKPLFFALMTLCAMGLVILYSAASKNNGLEIRQIIRLSLAFAVMIVIAQVSPAKMRRFAPWLYGVGMLLLLAVLIIGEIGKGAQRWLDLGIVTFQPSELMKIAVPLTVAWYLHGGSLPPSFKRILVTAFLIVLPTVIIAVQPDLGTALMIATAGGVALFLAGLPWWLLCTVIGGVAAVAPVLWHFLYDYQRERVLTFLNPERDPLGSGYHIIQSKIAIGSGGIFGKGWMQGTQSRLDFLPEHATDFIFAVCGEEFGLIGCSLLILAYLVVVARGFYIAFKAQDTFTRLLAGSISATFFILVFVNAGMVSGILPVVGLPLPLVSYGGTSMVTLMAGFGILMSIQTHRNLLSK